MDGRTRWSDDRLDDLHATVARHEDIFRQMASEERAELLRRLDMDHESARDERNDAERRRDRLVAWSIPLLVGVLLALAQLYAAHVI